jgi:hypothetical protein
MLVGFDKEVTSNSFVVWVITLCSPAKVDRCFGRTYRKVLIFVDRFMTALHGDRRTVGCEAHTNFDDESICLVEDNVRNEVVPIRRPQDVLKMLSLYM